MTKFEITGPGDYVTRDGRRVTIYHVKGSGSFPAKGSIWKMFRGRERPRGYRIWAANGRNDFHAERPTDIIGRWTDQDAAPASEA